MTSMLGALAGAGAGAVAGGLPERRVRPIWDAIDSRQFKNALKLVSALLTKHPNSPYALSLKALILERTGKPDEALSICLKAKELLFSNDSALTDDLTLSTLQIVLHRLDHFDLATSCYEHACAKYPSNLDLLMGLFNCYVRESAFVKQQQTAIKMYKVAGEERFLLWAVCSIQLQVLCGSGGEKLLLLAEGLLKKHISTHSLHEPEALAVYIALLEQQEKYADALEILCGNLGSLLPVEVDKLQIQGRLLACKGEYYAAAEVFEKILEICPDDWECFQHYLGCLLEDGSRWENRTIQDKLLKMEISDDQTPFFADDLFDVRISRATGFVQKLQEKSGSDFIRCPFLADLEIERKKLLHGQGDSNKLIEYLVLYFSRFGHLACFTSDVELFLQVLSPDERLKLLDKVLKISDSDSLGPVKKLGRSITVFKFQEMTRNAGQIPVTDIEDSALEMVQMYCDNLPLSKDLDQQESMHGEELLSMACNALVQLFWRTRNLGYIMAAVIVLEFGLTIRRYIWQYKMSLLHLYSFLGASSLAYEKYKALEVKNILLESVSHNILPQILVSPLWTDLSNLLKDYLKFMDDHFRESADLTCLAYRHRNYSKVIEFVQFKERLQCSNQYFLVRVELPLLQIKQNAHNVDEVKCILEKSRSGAVFIGLLNEMGSKSLTFNEDLETRPWWTPIPAKNYLSGPYEDISNISTEELVKERKALLPKYIERRCLLPRMIYLSIHNAFLLKDGVEANGSVPDPNILSELMSLLERYAKFLGHPLNVALSVIGDVARGSKSVEVFGADLIDWVNLAVFFNAWRVSSHEEAKVAEGYNFHCWKDVDSLLKKCLVHKLETISTDTSIMSDLPLILQLMTEPLAWHCLFLQSCIRILVPSGKKKKKTGSGDHSSPKLASAVRDSVQSLIGFMEELQKWLREWVVKSEDDNLKRQFLSMTSRGGAEGPEKVYKILKDTVSSASSAEVGDRIMGALKSWNPSEHVLRVVAEQRAMLLQTLSICESRIGALNALNKQIGQV
ncbi:hypothetical protein MLD38_017425 [Melastoma candidum]|uniref:Uncharacterized protein n=1 Tax=Melastoma candidum TaxID=119954 RepID=A0ACB9QQS8_9MYRT|nr:hypothetical protein MLD38_017425 [Melastoma candidum]